jgi:hypothetical protein
MQNIRWQVLLFQTAFWVTTELTLNGLSLLHADFGADDLADYSEFLTQKHLVSILKQKRAIPIFVYQV